MNESLDSRQVKAFVALARTGSYTETARQLYVTHSAISHAMKALEEQLGCRLFYKLGKKITLTEAGEALLHHSVRALEEMRRARATLGELKKWGTRRLRLAVDALLFGNILNAALVRFHGKMPDVAMQVEFCKAGEAATLLENNQVDLVFTERFTTPDRFEFIPLLTDSFQFVVGFGHPLAGKSNVPRDQAGKYPCVLLRDSGYTRKRLDYSLSRRGFRLNFAGEIESVEMIKHLVRETNAISFLPGWIVTPELKQQTMSLLPLPHNPPQRTWGLAHLPGHPLNHVEATLLKLCQDELKKTTRRMIK
ncbi:MAG TPA: LysR family transcriptional regulator [Candidatus Binatia bacterium]|nr:LysR family transcriptional regulator [Candidatus Binatia bacterium]